MSLLPFFKSPVVWKSAEVATVATTTTIWTPTTGKRAILENAVVSVYGPNSSTVGIYFGLDSLAVVPTRVLIVNLAASATVQLNFPGIDNKLANQPVRVITAAAPVTVMLSGFELE